MNHAFNVIIMYIIQQSDNGYANTFSQSLVLKLPQLSKPETAPRSSLMKFN
jgi:hypothetical protein